MGSIRLYLDQDVDVRLADRLKQKGYDTVTTRDAGNISQTDSRQLEYAATHGRAILTHNRRDFKRLHATFIHQGRHHYGIITSAHLKLDELEGRVLNLLGTLCAQQAENQLIQLHLFR